MMKINGTVNIPVRELNAGRRREISPCKKRPTGARRREVTADDMRHSFAVRTTATGFRRERKTVKCVIDFRFDMRLKTYIITPALNYSDRASTSSGLRKISNNIINFFVTEVVAVITTGGAEQMRVGSLLFCPQSAKSPEFVDLPGGFP
jgi:hypothetical protein